MYQDVPSGFSLPELENRILAFWEEKGSFEALREKNANGPRWSFLDGPITANNLMGVHHAWGRSYKDIYQRFHAMLGHQLRYQNGFDCQGLWVEVEVEKEKGFKSKRDIEDYGIGRFVNDCKARVTKYAKLQTDQSKRLGYWMDWDDSYYTMSDVNNYTIWHFLKRCHERGLIKTGHDVMPWCPRCGTAISDQEIVTEGYKELTHVSVYVKFPLLEREGESLLVWTTTPWTLTSNVAAAVNPDLTYVKVRQESEVYYLAKETVKSTLVGDYTIEAELPGKDLVGLHYRGPFDELDPQQGVEHVVIPWDDVEEDEGTGIVHTAPGCGKEDFALSKEHDLAVIAPLNESGIFTSEFGDFHGHEAAAVPDMVFESLRSKGLLYRTQRYAHRYPVCWRCNTELVFRLVDEWFIDMTDLRHEIAEVVKKINWIPSYGLEHELDWLRNMSDWCISKKRYWGLALPIYPCDACGHVDVIGSRDELKERAIEGWDQFDGESPHRPWVDGVKIACAECGAKVSRITDVGNPWLDAGIVPFSTMKYLEDREYWENWYPADFITESLPGQFRNWFYSLLAMSTVLENHEPFRTVLGHASVRDMNGEEMHKSQGNAIWFDDAAEKMGAETMRWLYAKQNPVNNLNFGYEAADEPMRHMTTVWNTYKFFVTYAKMDGYDPDTVQIPFEKLDLMDRWILARLNQLVATARTSMVNFALANLVRDAEEFINDLSNWYLRRNRDRFRQMDESGDLAAHQTLYTVLDTLIRVLAPVVPMFTEEIYQNLSAWRDGHPHSIHLTDYPEEVEAWADEGLVGRMSAVRKVVEVALAARNSAKVKIRQPLAKMTIVTTDEGVAGAVTMHGQIILNELNVKAIDVVASGDGLTTFESKPNFKTLGPRFGKGVKPVATALSSLSQEDLATLASGGEISVEIDGNAETFTSAEVMVSVVAPEGLAVAADKAMTVVLETNLTDDLLDEGFAREVINKIQNMRKDAGFNVADRIAVGYHASERLERAISSYDEYIRTETLSLSIGPLEGEWDHAAEWKINSEPARLAVRKYPEAAG
jgi:isoleucyl-tRNA synthetase